MPTKSIKSEPVQTQARPHVALRAGRYTLVLGTVPRVVGTLFSLTDEMVSNARDLACDIVEVRLDQMPRQKDWLERCKEIQAAGMPVILTARHKNEGGKWSGPESKRLNIYSEALKHLAAVDVELSSSISEEVARLAKKLGKVCILSHHNFGGVTSLSKLRPLIRRAGKLGAIAKIAMIIKSPRYFRQARRLLLEGARTPVCMLGMGPMGAMTRILFPRLGSCLTYGYLDVPAAPGQPFAPALVKQLREAVPQYGKEFGARKLELQVAKSDISLFVDSQDASN